MPDKEGDEPSKPYVIKWPKYEPLEEWLKKQPTDTWKEKFADDGFLVSIPYSRYVGTVMI